MLEPAHDAAPKILVVDDAPASLAATRRLLEGMDAALIEAPSGSEALAACREHEFALILLDLQMGGFEVASLLAGEPRTQHTPIIFATAALGTAGYITAPLSGVTLQSKVRVLLDLYRSRETMRRRLAESDANNRALEAEIAERKRIEEQMRHQAGHDALTDLPNRSLFMDRLEQALARAERSGKPAGLLYIDIDGFKPVNDHHGHQAGDVLLKAIAARLLRSTRRSDTVARLGGDEFAVIIEEVEAGSEAALQFARKISAMLQRPYDLEVGTRPLPVKIGTSIGLALFPQHATAGDCREVLINAADGAMYKAKQAGRNRVMMAGTTTTGRTWD